MSIRRRRRGLSCGALIAFLLASGAFSAAAAGQEVGPPPASLKLDPFYRKYVDAEGIPITTSARVPDAAVLAARDIVVAMLAQRPDLRRQLIRIGARVGVMAPDEMTTDLPEQRDWKKPTLDDTRVTYCERKAYRQIAAMTDREYWNSRARGMGGLYTTGAAENILGQPNTRYYGENILVHEFSHNILSAIREVDPALYGRVEHAFVHAQQQGLWNGSYSAQNIDEYWAEGTQFWFNSNMAYKRGALVVVNSDDLKSHDSLLHGVLSEVYPASHRIEADVFWMHPARMNSRPVPADGRDQC